MTKKALIYIEINNGKIEKVSKEIISQALKCFENTEINGIVLGDEATLNGLSDEFKQLGLHQLFQLKDNLLDTFNTIIFSDVLSQFIESNKSEILLMGATDNGRDLAPRTASKLNIGLTADCTDIKISEEGKLLATRPTYGGKMMATIISKTSPNFATIRPGAFKFKEIGQEQETELISFQPDITGLKSLLEVLYTENKPLFEDWTCAEIIVSGGLGLQSRENFELIYKLADLLGGKPAASRGAVEQGWASQEIQVGQTGSSVSPKLYIAFGISGAMQHMVGITNADRIIAVNIDRNAPIMESADNAIVADATVVLNTMISQLN